MGKFGKLFSLFGLLLIPGAIIAYIAVNTYLEAQNSSALYGGRVESGYQAAGFLINDTNTSSKNCGYVSLANNLAITAGHCVDDAKVLYIGKGSYTSDRRVLTQVTSAIAKEGWASDQRRQDDFAILSVASSDIPAPHAAIASPREACAFRVVAYGRTEDTSELATKPRKSALLCAYDIRPLTFKVKGYDSGICFGDSGSPVFIDGTNQVVGVIVSIVNTDSQSKQENCYINNEAIVVRADTNLDLISAQSGQPQSVFQADEDTTSLSVAEENLLDKIGLSSLNNLTQKEKYSYILAALVGMIVLVVIVIVTKLLRPNNSELVKSSYYQTN